MKRARPIEKVIINAGGTAFAAATLVHEIDDGNESYPGTIFGVHWVIRAHLLNALSNNGHLVWAIGIQRAGGVTQLNSVVVSGIANLLEKGAEVDIFASGIMYVQREDVVENGVLEITDKAIGSVKTERKVKTGDKVVILFRSDAVLGVSTYANVTYFKRT